MSLSTLGEGSLKKCARCKNEKPFDQFAKYKKARDGHQAYCRKCNTEAAREYVARHSGLPDCDCKTCVRKGLAAMGMKRCTKCAEIKPFAEFYVNRALKDGRQVLCIVCDLDKQAEVARNRKRNEHGGGCACETCISGVKLCNWCGETKGRDQFSVLRSSPDGLQQHCRSCQSWQRRYRRYGIDQEKFQEMLEEQGGRCAICPREFDDKYPPHIDHDHACCDDRNGTCGNCVRKLLCKPCNTALGQINDDPEIAISLAAYLIGYQDVLRASGGPH